MVGRVVSLHRYPVKSMLGEDLEAAEIGPKGIPGDRGLALVDVETGKVCSAKRHDLWGRLFEFRARIEAGDVVITFPDGTEHDASDPGIHEALSAELGRDVHLDASPPERARYEELWDDEVKGSEYYGPKVGEQGGETLIDVPASLAAPGGFFDAAPIHLITANTIAELGRLEPDTTFDVRRFRPNLLVEIDDEEGFVENGWSRIGVGDAALDVLMPVPRCVMTTLAQDDLEREPSVLRAAAKHNMIDTKILGEMPCAGVYCTVSAAATVARGASVEVG